MSLNGNGKVALITGASSGIGRASAISLADAGFQLALGARRVEKLDGLADEILQRTGKRPFVTYLDVTSADSCEQFISQAVEKFGKIHLLLNNAGLASGTDYIENLKEEDWQIMINTNIMGLLRMTKLVIPYLVESGDGHIINLGSIAGREAYAHGSVYCATKFAARAITDTLRQELLGRPVRITTIDPGMVETEFSVIRYRGDKDKADAVYANMQPLTAEDIADTIVYAATRPSHVNIDAIIIKPRDQAGAGKVARHQ